MAEDRLRILNMLSEGKITAEEAEKLLKALEVNPQEITVSQKESSSTRISDILTDKFLYVQVEPKEGKRSERVSVKVPLALLQTGLNIFGLIPKDAQDKINSSMKQNGMSFDLSTVNPENIKELMVILEEMKIDIDTEEATVQVFCR